MSHVDTLTDLALEARSVPASLRPAKIPPLRRRIVCSLRTYSVCRIRNIPSVDGLGGNTKSPITIRILLLVFKITGNALS